MARFIKMAKRLCLVDDLKMLKITMSNTSSRNKLNPEVNDHYNIFTRENQEYELKTKDKAWKGEYDIWSMSMRQYICYTYHNLWDVIVNGDLEEETAPTEETSASLALKTAKQLAAKRNQERVKSILLLAIPDEYLLKFHNVADAKSLWVAIKSSANYTSQNLAFLSSENTSSTNEVSTARGISQVSTTPCAHDVACSLLCTNHKVPQLENEDFQQIDEDDLEELDLRWRNATTNEPSSQALVAQDGLGGYD
ncbi:hypothetical protein Tco_0670243 [Tanacetum coccineum]